MPHAGLQSPDCRTPSKSHASPQESIGPRAHSWRHVSMAQRPLPPSFLCPISLEVMKDPVTLCTGQTYDRANIEKWLRAGHNTCPVTMMPLEDPSLIPNVIVRRLIQAWCADNGWKRSFKAQNIIPSNPAHVRECVLAYLKEIARGQQVQSAVHGLKVLAKESDDNKNCIVSTGGPLLLVSLLWVNPSDTIHEECDACEDALYILALLCRSSIETNTLMLEPQKLSWIVWHLRHGSMGAKIHAAALVKTLFKHDDTSEIAGKVKGLFEGFVSLLGEDLSPKSETSIIKVIERACKSKANSVRAIDAGVLGALVDVLSKGRKNSTERALATMELLCTTVEGKNAASSLPGFVPVLIDNMVGVSHLSTEHAAACMLEICSLGRSDVFHKALEAGIYQQLLLVLQSDATYRAKCKAQELLKRLHAVVGCGH